MGFYRVYEGAFDKGKKNIYMVDDNSINAYTIAKKKIPTYISTFKYDSGHKETFDKTKSVKGISNVRTNALWWDIDCEHNTEKAKETTVEIVNRLLKLNLKEENIQVRFSGGKGYHIWIDTEQSYSPIEVKTITSAIASDLEGFDTTLYDASQLLRVPFSINEKTKLYCIPLTLDELHTLTDKQIKETAKSIDNFDVSIIKNYYKKVKVPEEMEKLKPKESEQNIKSLDNQLKFNLNELNFNSKPKHLDNARWALQNGYFYGSQSKSPGDRKTAMLCLAASYANQKYDKLHTLSLLKAVAEIQAERTGEDVFPEDEIEDILNNVYSDSWRGGQFSVRDKSSWLYQYAIEYGIPLEETQKNIKPLTIGDIANSFIDFVENLEANTIKIGIPELDAAIPITTGMNLGLIGAAGSGKTAMALEILENTSKQGVISVCASLDMHRNRLYQKLLHRITGYSRDKLYDIFKNNPRERTSIVNKVKEKYKNVWFYDRSSPSVANIRHYIDQIQKSTGKTVKLVLIDYFERLGSDLADETAGSKRVAGEIQDLINDFDLAAITLVQPNKFSISGGPNVPILDFTAIKGSSFIYQAFRGIISLWRPFYTPALREHDHYMEMAILKNDLGDIGCFEFGWNGRQGKIKSLEDIERQELSDLKKELLQTDSNGNDW